MIMYVTLQVGDTLHFSEVMNTSELEEMLLGRTFQHCTS